MTGFLTLNGRKFYFAELLDGSYRETAVLDGYEDKTLEFCALWLAGTQEFVLTTSGTTGKPKQVTLTRGQMQASATATAAAVGLQKGDRSLACLNTEFIAGMMMLVRALELELEMTIINPVANPLIELPETESFEFAAFVPYQLVAMLEQPERLQSAFRHAKAILIGGGPIPVTLEQKLQELALPFYATYGSTETATHIALRKLNGEDKAAGFSPLPNVEIGLDERGCLWAKGPMTAEKKVQLNDLATILPDGTFRITGRFDRVINSGGIKIHPELLEKAIEVEMKLLGLHQDILVVGEVHPQLGESITLVMEGHPLPEQIEEKLLERLRENLSPYLVPKAIRYEQHFKRTATGKISIIR